MREKILWNPQIFKNNVQTCTKRRCSQVKPHLKVEKEDGREALYKPSIYKNVMRWMNLKVRKTFKTRAERIWTFLSKSAKLSHPYLKVTIYVISNHTLPLFKGLHDRFYPLNIVLRIGQVPLKLRGLFLWLHTLINLADLDVLRRKDFVCLLKNE